jgi:hypothetical protein
MTFNETIISDSLHRQMDDAVRRACHSNRAADDLGMHGRQLV